MFNEKPRHIGELAMFRQLDHLYRCDAMPPNRWYLFGALEGDVYLKPDGTTEPFAFRVESDKYRESWTWKDCGPVSRTSSGALILDALPIEVIAPVVVAADPTPAPRRGRAKGK